MKKLKKIICLTLAIGLITTLISFAPIQGAAKAASHTPLLSPSIIETVGEHIFVYDSASNLIFKRISSAPEENDPSPEILASKTVEGVLIMKATEDDNLLALVSTGTSRAFKLISNDLSSVTDVALSNTSYQTNMVVDFSLTGTTGYAMKSNGEIDIFTLSGNNIEFQTGAITQTNLEIINQGNITLKYIQATENTLYLSSTNRVFKVKLPSLSVTEIFTLTSVTGEEIINVKSTQEDLYVLVSGGKLAKVNQESGQVTETLSYNYNFNYIHVSSSNTAYLSSPSTHQIFLLSGTTLTDLKFNETIVPELYATTSLKYANVISTTGLYLQPYSLSPSYSLQEDMTLVVIGEAPSPYEYYFCLYVTEGTNHYLYLKKNDVASFVPQINSNKIQIVATRKSQLFTYPSIVEDAKNTLLAEIPAGTEFTATSSTIIQGASGELFYQVEYDGKTGYAESSSIQALKNAVELTLNCNARTKRVTTLFENADGSGEIITLNKNTRISVEEEISPSKDYVLVKYEAENGITYTGYLFTDDIDPDGLSTLQILGISLIAVNILVLSLIMIVKLRSKKWKHPEHREQE